MNSGSFVLSFPMQNFLDIQTNLDVMTHLAEGLSFREVADKIGKRHSFVQQKSGFLKRYKVMTFGRWNVDVRALGMTKTAEFYEYKPEIMSSLLGNENRNFYLSYLSHVAMGEMKYFAMYTYPEDVKDRTGIETSSWYYFFPHFTLPFFGDEDFSEKLKDAFENENNHNPLPKRGEKIKNPDLIDIYLCRYIQLELGDINLKRYLKRMKDEIGDLVDVKYSGLRTRFNNLRDKNVIYPVNPLDFEELSFIRLFFITSYDEIFRFLKAVGRLNMIAAISFMENGKNIVLIQCPYNRSSAVISFLSSLDGKCQIFSTTKTELNRGLPYKHYLKKFEKKG